MKTFVICAGCPYLTARDADLIIAGKAIVRGGSYDGQILPHKLTARTRPLFEKAKERGYLELPNRNASLDNVWHAWCEGYQQPPVVIRSGRRKWYRVKVDLISIAHHEKIEPIIMGALDDWSRRYARSKMRSSLGIWTEVYVDPSEAEAAARELRQIVLKGQEDYKKGARYEP
jgi:hypothetical protein